MSEPRFSSRIVLLLSAILAAFLVNLHSGDMSKPPMGMHTWAQSDHYALARGFVKNGLNFFLPQTALYNHQFPNNWKTPDPAPVTAVDFPIHNYIPAVFMKLTGSDSPLIFRWYTLLFSFAGLFYLYRLAFLFNRSAMASFLIVAFLACSPVFTFYQIRFIPSIPSLATAIIGFYYYFRYRENGSMRPLIAGIAFLTLASMTRMTFLIPLLSVFGIELIRLLKERKHAVRKVIIATASLALIGGYMLYNSYLRNTYGSLFLNVLMPFQSWQELVENTKVIFNSWKLEYFTIWHYAGFVALIAVYVYKRVCKRLDPVPFRFTGLLLILLFLGCILFYLVMCSQFRAHDYYFADTFFVPILLGLCVLSRQFVPANRLTFALLTGFCVVLTAGMFYKNTQAQAGRVAAELWGKNDYTTYCYDGSEKLINDLHIPQSEKLLVLTTVSPNIPFMEMKRDGYMTISNATENLQRMMRFPVNYVVFQSELFMTEIYASWPGIIDYLEIIGTNGRITVCRKTAKKSRTLFSFLQLDTKTPVFSAGFSDLSVPEWEIARRYNEQQKAYEVLPENDFGVVLKLRDKKLFEKDRLLLFEGEILWDQQKDIEFFTAFAEEDSLKMYKVYSMKNTVNNPGKWCEFRFLITIPKSTATGFMELSACLGNNKVRYFVRNVRARLY